MRIRRSLRHSRRRLAVLVAVIALGGVVSLHHSGLAMGAMDHGIGAGVAVCLAIVTAAGTAIAVAAVGLLLWRRRRVAPDFVLVRSSARPRPPLARARAGPVVLQVLRR
jgi:hypothetical protein